MDTNDAVNDSVRNQYALLKVGSAETKRSGDYGEQGENGYDLCTFRANLLLTPTQRVEKLNRALEIYFEVKRAGEKYRLSRRNSSPR